MAASTLPKLPTTGVGYARPPAPKLAKPKTIPLPPSGGGIWGPAKAVGAGAPKKTGAGSAGGVSFDPYASLLLPETNPATFTKTATTGYNSDVENARQLSQMGLPTDDQLTGQAATRSAALGAISAALQSHLASIQQAGVAQGNAQGTTLAGLNAGTSQPGMTPDAAAAPVQATLAGQTAGTGNYLGALEGAAAEGGAYQQSQALTQGGNNVQENQLARSKALAGFLSGLPTISDRVAGLQSDNSKIAAANVSTKLNVWNTLQTQIEQDKLEGDKVSLAHDQLDEKKWEAQQSNKVKAGIAAGNNATSLGVANTNQAGANGRTDAGIRAKAWQADQTRKSNEAIAKIRAGATIKAADIRAFTKANSGFKHVKVTVTYPAHVSSTSGGVATVIPSSTKSVPFTIQQWQKFLQKPVGTRNLSVLGLPDGATPAERAKVDYGTVVLY